MAQFVDALERAAKRKAESYALECEGDRLAVRDRRINPALPLIEAEGALGVQIRSLDWAQRLAGPVRLDVDARRTMARFSARVLHGACEVWVALIRHGAPVSDLLGPADLKSWLGPAAPSSSS